MREYRKVTSFVLRRLRKSTYTYRPICKRKADFSVAVQVFEASGSEPAAAGFPCQPFQL